MTETIVLAMRKTADGARPGVLIRAWRLSAGVYQWELDTFLICPPRLLYTHPATVACGRALSARFAAEGAYATSRHVLAQLGAGDCFEPFEHLHPAGIECAVCEMLGSRPRPRANN